MAASNGARLAFGLLLCCALASTVIITLLPKIVRNPCTYYDSLSRTILAATGLNSPLPIISCASDGGSSSARLSEGEPGGGGAGRPIVTDVHSCGDSELPAHALPPFQCCAQALLASDVDAPVTDFTFPDPAEPVRTRRPVHDPRAAEDLAKYERAVALMKALPESDPRNFYQQSRIHCAYCTGAYKQVGLPEVPVQIHYSWLFFPFHRAYLYFFERIAAKLLGDPGFAVPFWSWDVPEAMRIPPAFTDQASPLYDPIRNPSHAPPRVVDIDYVGEDSNYTDEQQIQINLRTMYKQMITNAPLPSLFHGEPYRAGDQQMPGAGTVEDRPHNTVHAWTGDAAQPNYENMGTYYSAGRDPIFYLHHANCDRLWKVWLDVDLDDGNGRRRRHADFTDPDWLDSSFVFYDEDARLVRVTVRDMLDIGKLRYTYAEVDMPWLNARPPVTVVNPDDRGRGGPPPPHLTSSVRFPVWLDAAVTARVRRPEKPRSQQEEEVLVVEGIEADSTDFVKFDVYVNAVDYEKVGPGGREMAASFVSLKHPGEAVVQQTSMRVALNELLHDLDAEGDGSVTVTLVPVAGRVRIGGLKIVYITQ